MKFKFYKAKEFVVLAENSPSSLHSIATALGESGINIDAITAVAKDENTVLYRIITNDSETAAKVLERTPHIRKVGKENILVVELENKPGELAKLTQRFLSKGVDVEALYIVRANTTTEVAVRASDAQKAEEALSES